MLRELEEIEMNLEDKEYLEEFQKSEHEKEVISRVVKKNKGNMDEPLKTEEPLDIRTENAWIKKKKTPRKSYRDKIRKMADYLIYFKEVKK